ncbi:hypothetical protein [Amycolatopsis sp. NBC_01480]|uniref:hypothetical protein n=1 Tax=Amycolatopsis sp. NBC_01480 TaxID=2903562 RepID=UPI002E27C4B0|nr:hypothetical protein [Amycolatopsis sp. NBC_01480]
MEPAEHLSPASRYGTTPAEVREGEPIARRLAEEQPDDEPGPAPERPVAATPATDLDESIDAAPADVEPVAPPEDVSGRRRANQDPREQADEAGGSVADALRAE